MSAVPGPGGPRTSTSPVGHLPTQLTAAGTHQLWGTALTELQERGGCVIQQQQDPGAHVDGPGVFSVEDQRVGAGAVRGVYKVLETE